MHQKIIKVKSRVAPIVNKSPIIKSALLPAYTFGKKIYNKTLARNRFIKSQLRKTDDDTIPDYYLNKKLSKRQAEHQARLHNRKILYYEPESNKEYAYSDGDPRIIAVYLPQFHKVPLNEKTWGKGFTEWTNVASSTPSIVGHQQPMLPADLGFYDLDRPEKIKEQIDLAKKYGIHGFMFYYYWFSGKKILDVPLETFLNNKSWDFNFMICWANENWTKRWDGMDSEVIIGQEYNMDDPLNFIKDVAPILNDERYIRVDGNKPILAVYRPSTISNIEDYVSVWRNYFRDNYGKELYLIVGNNHTDSDPREYGFDAMYDFSPGSVIWGGAASEIAKIPEVDYSSMKLDPNFYGSIVDYRSIALNDKIDAIDRYPFPTYQAIIPHWDNHARKKGKDTHALINSTPEIYASWLDRILEKYTKKQKSPIVFINAWNEWAEGATLEPTMHLGHANLLRTAEVLSKYSNNKNNAINFPMMATPKSESKKIAVVIHLFYPEMWDILTERFKYIKQDFDIFVTIPEKHKEIKLKYQNIPIHTYVVPNWGRDMLPFIHVMSKIRASGYEYVLKIHSKKSNQISRINATYWLQNTLDSLLFSEDAVSEILNKLKGHVKIIGPEEFATSMSLDGELSLKKRINKYYDKKVANKIIKNIKSYKFSAGSMFWLKSDAFDDILKRRIVADDFEMEYGQLWDTLAHFLERDIWINIQNKYTNKSINFISSEGEIIEFNSLSKMSSDLDLPKKIASKDKTKINKIDGALKVSIVITNYNYGKYLGAAIKSSLKQTYKNTEIIIVDDGSTDVLSAKVIYKYTKKYPRKILAYMNKHKGVVYVRNFALSKISGEFVIFLDADDCLPKEYVANMLEEAVYGNLDVVYADMHNFGSDYQISVMPEFSKAQMFDHNLVNMSALIRRSSIGNLKFDEYLNTRKVEDWDFFLGMMLSGSRFGKNHSTFLKYRIHKGQRNNNLNRDEKFWEEHNMTKKYIKDKYRKLYPEVRIPD